MDFKAVRLDEVTKGVDEDRKKKSQELNPGVLQCKNWEYEDQKAQEIKRNNHRGRRTPRDYFVNISFSLASL